MVKIESSRVPLTTAVLIAVAFFLGGAALGHLSRRPTFGDRALIQRIDSVGARLAKVAAALNRK